MIKFAKQIRYWLKTFYHYKDLLVLLVERDVKLKYRRSFLGYLWSIMNPLFIMVVLTLIFSRMFRRSISNFPVYLIVGRACFDFMSEATRQSMQSVTGNASLLKKTDVPRYIFTVARVSSAAVNFMFSLGALAIVLLWTKTLPTWRVIFLPFTLMQLYVFCLGLGLFLAAANVFFRDIQYIYNAVITAWMYLSALFYPVQSLPSKVRWWVTHANPMYLYIDQARSFVMSDKLPPSTSVVGGCVAAALALLIGVWMFHKHQRRFILYI